MAWANETEVSNLTGVAVGERMLAQAQGIIEVAAGLTEEQVGPADARHPWMLRAVAYQAAFLAENPDAFGVLDVASEHVESHVYRTRDGDPYAAVLAPLAKQALVRAGIDVTGDGPPNPAFSFPPADDVPNDLTHGTASPWRPSYLVLDDGTEVSLR